MVSSQWFKEYKESADVYSFGMLICELDSHDVPYAKVTNQENVPLREQAVLVRLAMGLLNPIEAIDSIENTTRPERGGESHVACPLPVGHERD